MSKRNSYLIELKYLSFISYTCLLVGILVIIADVFDIIFNGSNSFLLLLVGTYLLGVSFSIKVISKTIKSVIKELELRDEIRKEFCLGFNYEDAE